MKRPKSWKVKSCIGISNEYGPCKYVHQSNNFCKRCWCLDRDGENYHTEATNKFPYKYKEHTREDILEMRMDQLEQENREMRVIIDTLKERYTHVRIYNKKAS